MISSTGCSISDADLALWSGCSLVLGVCWAPWAKGAFTLQDMKQLFPLHGLAPVVIGVSTFRQNKRWGHQRLVMECEVGKQMVRSEYGIGGWANGETDMWFCGVVKPRLRSNY